MLNAALADLTLVVHGLFIVFVVLGGWLCLRWPRIAWIQIPAAVWGSWIEFSGWTCPLTLLENHFRMSAGNAGYGDGFIQHYLIPLIYPPGLTAQLQWWLGAAVLLINIAAYTTLWLKHRRRSTLQP